MKQSRHTEQTFSRWKRTFAGMGVAELRSIRAKHRRKRVSVARMAPPRAERPNERWSLDFLTDSLVDGRRFRACTLGDTVSRVSPAIEVDGSLTGERVVAVLDRLQGTVGLLERLAVDNGPEFISKALDAWAYLNGVALECSRPGKPTDTAFVESFNGTFREEWLNQHRFETLAEARTVIEAWRVEDTTERPHRAVRQRTPAAVEAGWTAVRTAAD